MKYIIYIFAPFVFFISMIVPKKNNLWLFGAWFGDLYSDNSKYLFEYINKNNHEINTVWIYKNKKIKLTNKNYNFVYAYSIKGIYYQLRAKVFVSSVNSNDFIPFLLHLEIFMCNFGMVHQ